MRKNNNKGFTLLELLISIFILTTVIFIGYSIINKSTTYIQNRKNIHEGQLAVNDINKYLTDDLKHATSVILSSNYSTETNTFTEDSTQENGITNGSLKDRFEEYLKDTEDELSTDKKFTYSYNINYKKDEEEIKIITYNVKIIKENNNYKYSISREATNEVLITFITNKILTDEVLSRDNKLPLKIELESPYEVTLGYTGKNNYEFVEHQFAIASRLYAPNGGDGSAGNGSTGSDDIPPEQETPPPVDQIIPPDEWEDSEPNIPIDYNAIGFWTADSSGEHGKKEDNLYTWVSSEGKILGHAYADQIAGEEDIFNIEGEARPANNEDTSSYIGYGTRKNDTNWEGQVKEVYIGDKGISEISIYISEGTILEDFKIEKQQGNATITIDTPLHEGWNHCTITKNGSSKVNFNFSAKLSIDKSKVSSGYAYVIYKREASSNDLKGDFIFEFSDMIKEPNSNQYKFTQTIKDKYNEIFWSQKTQNPTSLTQERQLYFFIDTKEKYVKLFMNPDGREITIYQNQIDKDLSKISKIKVSFDDNISYIRSDGGISLKKVNNYYEGTFDHFQENINMYFNISNIPNSDIKNGKVYLELIE